MLCFLFNSITFAQDFLMLYTLKLFAWSSCGLGLALGWADRPWLWGMELWPWNSVALLASLLYRRLTIWWAYLFLLKLLQAKNWFLCFWSLFFIACYFQDQPLCQVWRS